MVVLTIDPARRLAQSLGLGELDNTPRPVAGVDCVNGGSLDAMMLDMKRTFDDVVFGPFHLRTRPTPSCGTRSTRPCRPLSREPRNTWPWKSWGSCTPRRKATAAGI